MQVQLEDDNSAHQEEVDRLGIEGVVEANHLHNELVDMRRSDLHSEMRKLMEDIAKTEALLKEAHAALAQKEEDKQELVQMRNALEDKLASDDGDDPDVDAMHAEVSHIDDKIAMVSGSCEAIGRCVTSYQMKMSAAQERLAELSEEESKTNDPLICATPRESARMHGALVGASHHSTAACLHPETGEACVTLSSSLAYSGEQDSENMGLNLALEPTQLPETYSLQCEKAGTLALPPLPPSTSNATAAWSERRTAALSAATRPVRCMSPQPFVGAPSPRPAAPSASQTKLEDAKSSLETMQGLQQEMEEWKTVLQSKINKMEAAEESEEDIETMRNELATVEEKLSLHIKDVENISQEIAKLEHETLK